MPSVSPSARPAETARPVPATRPRNRRQLIVDAAGRVFSERGY
ncbi:TetR family transcriptional regulator, partial [Streptomyces hydrogenans]